MLSLRHKIAQMLIMGFSGTVLFEAHPVNAWISAGLGGVILFDQDMLTNQPGKNIEHRQQLLHLNAQLQASSARYNQYHQTTLPLLIAVDYEGGAVNRLRHIEHCPTTCSPELYAKLPMHKRMQLCQEMANTLRELQFNVNFAPVVDLALNKSLGIIARLGRSFSENAAEVAQLATEFLTILAQKKIIGCYKHFPGHGSASGDTHHSFVDVSETFASAELLPYCQLTRALYPAMVMTAHVINRQLDADALPATLSQPIISGLLRQKIGFNGIVVSDDLQMAAIAQHYSLIDALQLTINAGVDMIIFGNQLGTICAFEVIDLIEQLVCQNKITLARIEEAYARIQTAKRWLVEKSA